MGVTDAESGHPPVLDNISFGEDFSGSFFSLPDFGTQTLNGDGNNFHVDQVNSLVNNGYVSDVSNGLTVYSGDDAGYPLYSSESLGGVGGVGGGGGGGGGSPFNFTQNATATGAGLGPDTTYSSDGHSPVSASISAATSLTQEAFTQHIVLGSNIQYNSLPTTVVGGDSFSDVGDVSTHHH